MTLPGIVNLACNFLLIISVNQRPDQPQRQPPAVEGGPEGGQPEVQVASGQVEEDQEGVEDDVEGEGPDAEEEAAEVHQVEARASQQPEKVGEKVAQGFGSLVL